MYSDVTNTRYNIQLHTHTHTHTHMKKSVSSQEFID